MSPIFRYTALLLIPFLLPGPTSAQVQSQNEASLGIHVLAKSLGEKPLDANALSVEVKDAQGAPVIGAAVIFRLPEDGPSGTFADGGRVAVVNTDSSGRAFVGGIHWTAAGTVSVRVTATKGTAHAGILIEREAAAAVPPTAAKLAPAPIIPAVQDPIPPKPIAPAQSAASQLPAPAEPEIAPPHVSITSVSRKQGGPAQASGTEPGVVITGVGQRNHSGSKKWIILAAIAAGAAGGAAYMLSRGKSSSVSAASSSGVSIGAPTISIGAP